MLKIIHRSVVLLWLLVPLHAFALSPPPQTRTASYLHLSDVHLDLSAQSGDTDPQLWAITQEKLAAVLAAPDAPAFIVYTGDLPGHYDCEMQHCALTPAQIETHDKNVQAVLGDLNALVAKSGTPLLYMPGNNDSLAGDYFSFSNADGKTPLSLAPNDPFPAPNASKPCGQAPCMVSAPHPAFGFYSVRPVPGLRVIALNSIILGTTYHAVDGTSQLDAGNLQLDWLQAELAAAKGNDKVLIAMHIPPGKDAYAVSHYKAVTSMWATHPDAVGDQPRKHTEHWLDRFLDLISLHRDEVVGLAFGHTHMDELRLLHDRAGGISAVAISAPGITTTHGNNPGFKRVSFDPRSFELLDFVTLYTQNGNATWGEQSYRFADTANFDCGKLGVLACLRQTKYASAAAVDALMQQFYTVQNGPPTYQTVSGIAVDYGQ